MRFLNTIRSFFAQPSQVVNVARDGSNPYWEAFTRGVPLTNSRNPQLTSPYSQHAVVFACVRVIYETFGQIPLKFYRGEAEVTSHPLITRLQNPAPYLTATDLWHFTVMFLELTGNCLWWLDNDGDIRTIPRNILVFHPKYFTPIIDRQTGMVAAYRIQLGGSRDAVTLSLDEVVHFRYPNPDDPFWGLGPLQVAALSAQQDYSAGQYNNAFFENAAEPGGLMLYKGKQQLTVQQRTQIKEGWYDTHGGVTKAFRLGVLPGEDWDYKQLGLSHRDMEFLEQRMWNLRDISRCFNVPLLFLNEYEKTGLSDAGVKAQINLFWDTNEIPKARFLTEAMNVRFVTKVDQNLTCLFDVEDVPARQQDYKEKLEHAKLLKDLGYGLNQINELLDLGMQDVPWGNEPLVATNLVPISAVMDGLTIPQRQLQQDQQQLPPPEKQQPPRALLTAHSEDDAYLLESPEMIARASERQEQRFSSFWKSYTDTIEPLERTYQASIRKLFYSLRVETLRNLTEVSAARSLTRVTPEQDVESILFSFDPARRELRTISEPLFAQSYEAGGLLVLGELGFSDTLFTIESTAARTFLQNKLVRVTGILDTVREQLRDSLIEGFEQSEPLVDLVERVRRVMNSANSRSLTIARTEIGQAVSGGRYEAMKEQHIEKHLWLSSRDRHVRESHAPKSGVDGEIRELGKPFSNGLLFPLDPAGPADQICNCRCVSVGLV